MERTRKASRRHTLLLYRRLMDRLWGSTLTLGLILLGIGAWGWFSDIEIVAAQNSLWLLVGAAVILAFTLFAFLGRNMAYVQAQHDHIRLVTPFLNLRISYRRILTTHPADFHQLFPAREASWASKRLLEPFYGMTAVVLELTQYPLPMPVLRLFLAPQMFNKQKPGLVLLVPDWMALSTEFDAIFGAWLQNQGRRRGAPGQAR